jgi:peptide/nickel transport system permease protein
MSDLRIRIGAVLSLLLLLVGFVSLVWTPAPIDGHDIVSPLMRGLLTSYVAAGIGIAIGVFIGVPLGLTAALFGSAFAWFGNALAGFLTVIPALAVAALLATLSGPGPLNVMAAVGVATIPIFATATREATAALLRRPYVEAARLAGLSGWEAAIKHAFPDLGPFILAQILTQLSFAVLAEAALSFVGIGAADDGLSLGLMLRMAQSSVLFDPMPALGAGAALVLVAGGLQLAASGIRGRIDPARKPMERDDALA